MKENVIADAKYKYMIKSADDGERISENIDRDDLHQMISYLHITSSNIGVFITPTTINIMNHGTGDFSLDSEFVIKKEKLFTYRVGELEGDGGEIFIMGVNIPQSVETYRDFVESMENTESILIKAIQHISIE